MSRSAIVFGGSGFIGFHLLRSLASSRQYERIVSVDIRQPADVVAGVQYIEWDIRRPIDSGRAEKGATVYNLAAIRDFPGHPDQEYYEENVLTAQRVIDFCNDIDASELVFTSTMSVYGPGDDPKTESSVLRPVNPYGASKCIAEALHEGWWRQNREKKLIICRPAVIFGYRDRGNYTRLARALEKGYFLFVGSRETIKSSGYVGDLVKSFQFCRAHEQNRIVYNFAYPTPYTVSDVVEAFRAVSGYRRPLGTIPRSLMTPAAMPFEFLSSLGLKNPIHRDRLRKLYESTHIVPQWLVDNGFEFATDLVSALEAWREESPGGRFI